MAHVVAVSVLLVTRGGNRRRRRRPKPRDKMRASIIGATLDDLLARIWTAEGGGTLRNGEEGEGRDASSKGEEEVG